jgi:hypothetical protein
VAWDVVFVDEFERWWDALSENEQESVAFSVRLLEEQGPRLRSPHSSGVNGSRHHHMRELRIQHQGSPYRILYAFDPRRSAVLLLGGDKTGNDGWYQENVPKADRLYDRYLEDLGKEG